MEVASRAIELKGVVAAPPAELYHAFTNSTLLRRWLCDAAQAVARPGGRLYLAWYDGEYACGDFTHLDPGREARFTWRGRNEAVTTHVHVTLEPQDGRTAVTIGHSGFDDSCTELIPIYDKAWTFSLENLQSVWETGHDLRYTRRPMLGVNIGEFNADIAMSLGVPATTGIHLDGVVEGLGAQRAGLQKDDVIIGFDDSVITDWPSLTTILQSHQAGDTVTVTYYRGNERRKAAMVLSARPIQDVPFNAEELAALVGRQYDHWDAELEKALAGVSEAQAARRPRPDEWSAKETLAHLIGGERETHTWLADLINGDERVSDGFSNPTAVPVRLQATLAAYPTVADLLTELKRHERETVAILAALPPEFVARRALFYYVGANLLGLSDHMADHLNQIQFALDAAG